MPHFSLSELSRNPTDELDARMALEYGEVDHKTARRKAIVDKARANIQSSVMQSQSGMSAGLGSLGGGEVDPILYQQLGRMS